MSPLPRVPSTWKRIAAAALPDLWRPIHHAAHDWPLALCDCNSIDRSRDLVMQTLKYPDHAVMWNESHRWKYVCGITLEEGVLVSC
ncbi:hypothetical protein EDB92DRAFT_1857164 [Lactarius akahatsu]|uniref:Uncharacterized protein n=1 Tax=Lactarius akahatsu TaxID=416441 RepID=A0AAD4QBE4_9AGAM|nr:hypothetical protein EDB92DRAFT_1857164 [Lactarius akahatsu]